MIMFKFVLLSFLSLAVLSVSGFGGNSAESEESQNLTIRGILKAYSTEEAKWILSQKPCPEVDYQQIRYILYTREKPAGVKLDWNNDLATLNAGYNVNRLTKIIIPSYMQKLPFAQNMIEDYLYLERVNVIVVDWTKYSMNCDVDSIPGVLVPGVGGSIARLIGKFMTYGAAVDKMHLIGAGVGAHIAGVSAKLMKPRIMARISALDPIGFVFDSPAYKRLESDDAQFIDVIHTSIPNFGSARRVGNLEFYPNGGKVQPSAKNGQCEEMGSHLAAIDYFSESVIRKQSFAAKKAESWTQFTLGQYENVTAYMGEHVQQLLPSGSYYLKTNDKPPYGRYEEDY